MSVTRSAYEFFTWDACAASTVGAMVRWERWCNGRGWCNGSGRCGVSEGAVGGYLVGEQRAQPDALAQRVARVGVRLDVFGDGGHHHGTHDGQPRRHARRRLDRLLVSHHAVKMLPPQL